MSTSAMERPPQGGAIAPASTSGGLSGYASGRTVQRTGGAGYAAQSAALAPEANTYALQARSLTPVQAKAKAGAPGGGGAEGTLPPGEDVFVDAGAGKSGAAEPAEDDSQEVSAPAPGQSSEDEASVAAEPAATPAGPDAAAADKAEGPAEDLPVEGQAGERKDEQQPVGPEVPAGEAGASTAAPGGGAPAAAAEAAPSAPEAAAPAPSPEAAAPGPSPEAAAPAPSPEAAAPSPEAAAPAPSPEAAAPAPSPEAAAPAPSPEAAAPAPAPEAGPAGPAPEAEAESAASQHGAVEAETESESSATAPQHDGAAAPEVSGGAPVPVEDAAAAPEAEGAASGGAAAQAVEPGEAVESATPGAAPPVQRKSAPVGPAKGARDERWAGVRDRKSWDKYWRKGSKKRGKSDEHGPGLAAFTKTTERAQSEAEGRQTAKQKEGASLVTSTARVAALVNYKAAYCGAWAEGTKKDKGVFGALKEGANLTGDQLYLGRASADKPLYRSQLRHALEIAEKTIKRLAPTASAEVRPALTDAGAAVTRSSAALAAADARSTAARGVWRQAQGRVWAAETKGRRGRRGLPALKAALRLQTLRAALTKAVAGQDAVRKSVGSTVDAANVAVKKARAAIKLAQAGAGMDVNGKRAASVKADKRLLDVVGGNQRLANHLKMARDAALQATAAAVEAKRITDTIPALEGLAKEATQGLIAAKRRDPKAKLTKKQKRVRLRAAQNAWYNAKRRVRLARGAAKKAAQQARSWRYSLRSLRKYVKRDLKRARLDEKTVMAEVEGPLEASVKAAAALRVAEVAARAADVGNRGLDALRRFPPLGEKVFTEAKYSLLPGDLVWIYNANASGEHAFIFLKWTSAPKRADGTTGGKPVTAFYRDAAVAQQNRPDQGGKIGTQHIGTAYVEDQWVVPVTRIYRPRVK